MAASNRTPALFVAEDDRALLLSWLASAALTPSMALRARIVLGSAGGEGARAIARALGVSIETVYLWRRRFEERGIEGLRSQALPGRRSRIESQRARAILRAGRPRTEEPPPSVAAVARAAGVSRATVRRLWERYGVSAGGGSPAGSGPARGPATIAGIFIDLPFRALARVRPAATPAHEAAAPGPTSDGGRSGRGRAVADLATPARLLAALEAFGGAAALAPHSRHAEGPTLGAWLDQLGGETTPATVEILTLAGPRVAPGPSPAAARAARLIRARTQGEWLTRASRWLADAPAQQEPALREALGHLLDYFAAWTGDSGPFVWMPGSTARG